GGVRVRRGDVPQSSVLLAAYAGPTAPAEAVRQAESVAASVRLVPTSDPLPAPPAGSKPGFAAGVPTVPDDRLKTVATATANGLALTLDAGDGCAVVRAGDSHQPLAGGCADRPAGGDVTTVATTVTPGLPPVPPVASGANGPATFPMSLAIVVVARAGGDVRGIRAVLVDGGNIDAVPSADGWAILVTTGRPYRLDAYDGRGRLVGEAVVP
ncbi:MAG: hypothetical protein LC792_02565, partial [Actinobacteria bacterium]|nr:hypothetical protein [Actinomycetota bacterium]